MTSGTPIGFSPNGNSTVSFVVCHDVVTMCTSICCNIYMYACTCN